MFDFVCEFLNRNVSEIAFIDASGGLSKTFLLKTILAKVRSTGNCCVAVASSDIAAASDARKKNCTLKI